MVNSGSFDCDIDRTAKTRFRQGGKPGEAAQPPAPATATSVCARDSGFSQTADSPPLSAHAIEPTATKTEYNCTTMIAAEDADVSKATKAAVFAKTGVVCSVPLDRVQGLISDGVIASKKQITKKLLCLYCDRTFVTTNLRQKHVDRCHSVKQTRRQSSRRFPTQETLTNCIYCDKLNKTDHSLKELFVHLASAHANKYFACVPCEDRFATLPLLSDHNATVHTTTKTPDIAPSEAPSPAEKTETENNAVKLTRSKKCSNKTNLDASEETIVKSEDVLLSVSSKKVDKIKKKSVTCHRELRSKKLAVKSTKIGGKRVTRLQHKVLETSKTYKKQTKTSSKSTEDASKNSEKPHRSSASINPYPQFDSFFQVKKITDHSIDNLRISTLTFDDVFDKAFYNRIKCNIQENLLNHIDGKLFKNEESESRISNFEKVVNPHQEIHNGASLIENFGCDISLNAATPVANLLSSQFGEDLESQIEYGSKASKKKNTQTRSDEVHYKYFTRRKYQASILESKENRDLSKLDMWTQLVIKNRQQKIANDKKSPKELLDYTKGQEYKTKQQQEELNRILDKRGPFEDLKEEATKKAALDKMISNDGTINEENLSVAADVLNEIVDNICLNQAEEILEHKVFDTIEEIISVENRPKSEISDYLRLRCSSSVKTEEEIDKSDRITLICSSQETENFEAPTATSRKKNELVELTGEWARTKIYICAACGLKVSNMKQLIEHKGVYHQNVWCQHYEFVGNQSELYRHLSIPGLGKIGQVEKDATVRFWQRSTARLCSKCSKLCNSLGELHRHVLECGGDWSWMLARKKCKYRPFGAKTRRKRRGLVKRIVNTERKPQERKKYKKRFEGPRPKPSDAESIQRMLANLPAKRATRTVVSLKDGIRKTNRKQVTTNKNAKVKCGKVIYRKKAVNNVQQANANVALTKTTNNARSAKSKYHGLKENVKSANQNTLTRRKSLRCINKVLSSRILDTNATLVVKRKLKSAINNKSVSESSAKLPETDAKASTENEISKKSKKATPNEKKEKPVAPSTSPDLNPAKKSLNTSTKTALEKIKAVADKKSTNLKNFFPVTKTKSAQQKLTSKSDNKKVTQKSKTKDSENVQTTQIKQSADSAHKNIIKKSKLDIIGNFMRTLSVRRTKTVPAPKTETEIKAQDKKKPSVKRKLRNTIENAIKKVRPNGKKKRLPVEIVQVDGSPQESSNCRKNSNHFLEAAEESKEIGEEDDKMPLLEKIPETPEKCEDIKDLPILTPAILNFDAFTTKTNLAFRLETTEKITDMQKESLKEKLDNKSVSENTQIVSEKLFERSDNCAISNKPEMATTMPDLTPTEHKIDVKINFDAVPKNSGNTSENKSVANPKTKQKKPKRLNDCIAMLTSKLQQKVVEEKEPVKKANHVFLPVVDNFVSPIIEKPPFIMSTDVEEEVLDLSISKKEKLLNIEVSDINKQVICESNICEEKNEKIVTENITDEPKEVVEDIDRDIDELLLTDKMKELIENALNEVVEEVPRLNGSKIQENEKLLVVNEEKEFDRANEGKELLFITNEANEEIKETLRTKCANGNKVNQKRKKKVNKKAVKDTTNEIIPLKPFSNEISDVIAIGELPEVVKQSKKESKRRPKRKSKLLQEKESAINIELLIEEKIEVNDKIPNGMFEISSTVTPKLRPKRRSKMQQKEILVEKTASEAVIEPCVEKQDDEILDKIPIEELSENKITENDRIVQEETKLEEIPSTERIVEVAEITAKLNEFLDKTNEITQLNGRKVSQKRKKKPQQAKNTRQKKTKIKTTNNNINADEILPEIKTVENTIITEDVSETTIESKGDLQKEVDEQRETAGTESDDKSIIAQKEIDDKQKINNNDFDGIEENTISEKQFEGDLSSRNLINLESQILDNKLNEEDELIKVIPVSTEKLETSSASTEKLEATPASTEKLPPHPSDSEDELPLAALIKSSNNQNSSDSTNVEVTNSENCEINSEIVPLIESSFQKPAAKTRKTKTNRKAANRNRKSNKRSQITPISEETAEEVNKSAVSSENSVEFNDSFISSKSIDVDQSLPEEETFKNNPLIEISLDKSLNSSNSIEENSNKDTSTEDDKLNAEENILEKVVEKETLQDATNLTTPKKQTPKKQNGKKNCISGIQNNPFEFLDIWDDKEKESEWLFQSAIKAQANALNAETPTLKDDLQDQIESPIFKIKPKNSPKRTKKVKNIPPPPAINDSKEFFCDICSKNFVRNENLIKHFKTLKHIAKLSEIEAKQALETNAAKNVTDMSEGDINICNILHNSDKYIEDKIVPPHPVVSSTFSINTAKSDTLKLADIINDVLNKPVEDISNKHSTFSNIILQSTEDSMLKPKVKRCKSLGERKSFESDNVKSTTFNDFDNFSTTTLENNMNNIFTKSNNVSTDTMLEKQISLLENIIENRKSINYLDDISISSTHSVVENPSPSELSSVSDQINFEENNVLSASMKLTTENNFLKPVQYEEISEDSINFSNSFEDQKSRKALNRDEELFLECCSLLKSGSEISNYSKRSSRIAENMKNACNRPSLEPDVLEHKNFSIHREFTESSHFMSDASRIPTPLGDNFGNDGSSDSLSFNWKMEEHKLKTAINGPPMFEDISEDKSISQNEIAKVPEDPKEQHFNFHFQFNEPEKKTENEDISVDEDHFESDTAADEETNSEALSKKKSTSKFGGKVVSTLKKKFGSFKTKPKHKKKKVGKQEDTLTTEIESQVTEVTNEAEINPVHDNKKLLTKGAMKVFEGLKVSIPTGDLDLSKVLNCKTAACNNAERISVEEKVEEKVSEQQEDEEEMIEEKAVEPEVKITKNEEIILKPEPISKTKPNKSKLKKIGSKLIKPKIFKKNLPKKTKNGTKKTPKNGTEIKNYDIYDFEETQDNSDIFTVDPLSHYRTFRSQITETLEEKPENLPETKEPETSVFTDTFSFEAHSVSSVSTSSNLSAKKTKTDKNITKKKCMIMGRIFKNALKSKMEDNIREIPVVDNAKLVNDYVQNCPASEDKSKMNQEELDEIFDKLVAEKDGPEENASKGKNEQQKSVASRPKAIKNQKPKKRARNNSESTDDEFSLNKPSRKRSNKKNVKNVDNSINLEQELRECIGVASRKSQRKCTSGKQNVLVEYWSSDESISETILENKEIQPITEETTTEKVLPEEKEDTVEKTIEAKPKIEPKPMKNPTAEKPKNKPRKPPPKTKLKEKPKSAKVEETLASNRRKRSAANTLYYWSSSSEDEFQDLIETKPIRDEFEDEDRPMQHGWIVGDSPKKLVTMLAQAKGKKLDVDCVKEQAKNKSVACS